MKKRGELHETFIADAKGPLQQLKINHAYLLSLAKTADSKKPPADQAQTDLVNASVLRIADVILSSVDQKELLASLGKCPYVQTTKMVLLYSRERFLVPLSDLPELFS